MMMSRRAGVVLVLALAMLSTVLTLPTRAGDLVKVPNLTAPQSSMAAAIDVVCPKLVAAGFAGQSSDTGDLTRRCREMRQNANANQPAQGGATTFSLGLTNDQLANALGLLTQQDATVQGTGAIETGTSSTRAVAGRLRALRQGGRGLNISGLFLPPDKRLTSANDLVGFDASDAADTGDFGRLGGFLNGAYSFGDKDGTEREAGFDFKTGFFTAGLDYRFTDAFVGGVALSYARSEAEMDSNLGDVDTDSFGISLYGTAYWGGFYVDGLLGFTWNRYDMSRRISYAAGPGAGAGAAGVVVDRTAKADTDAPQFMGTLGLGYEFRPAGWVLSPFVRAEFVGLFVDSYTEKGAGGLDLHVKKQDVFSLQHAIGAQIARPISLGIGVLTPYVRAEWRHEYMDNNRRITAKYANDPFNIFFSIPTDEPDRDFMGLAVGVSNQFKGGVSAFVNYETVLGLRDVTAHTFTAGLRIEF